MGLCQEPGWETVIALFLPETTDSSRQLLASTGGQLDAANLEPDVPLR